MSEPKCVTIGGATLYHGDCLQLLAEGLLKCDAIVSDPPYGMGDHSHGGGGGGKSAIRRTDKVIGDDVPFDPMPWVHVAPRGPELRGGREGKRIILFCADHFRQRLPEYGTLLAWDKHLGMGCDDSFADCEWAWSGVKVKREVFRHLWKGLVKHKESADGSPTRGCLLASGKRVFATSHVSQKPVALMRWCIQKVKPKAGGVILDPYMGSGTTGIAALSLGYRFVGCEIDAEIFDIACDRIGYYVETTRDKPCQA